MKLERDADELSNLQIEFQSFFTDFDYEMDFMANSAAFSSIKKDFERIEGEFQ